MMLATFDERRLKEVVGTTARVECSSHVLSFLYTGWILAGFMLISSDLIHWFVIPIFFCGFLIGIDAIDWFRGRVDLFDPVGIIGLLGYHFFFLAPLLHVRWDYWMRYAPAIPDDWRPWLGGMALLNAGGIAIYRLVRRVQPNANSTPAATNRWSLDIRRFTAVLVSALILTAVLQVFVYASYGGLTGYIDTYTARYSDASPGFEGMGLLFSVSESFPILALMGYAVYARSTGRTRSWIEICVVLLVFVALKLLFGGLRGSRSNTVWGVFWAVGILHFWVRPVTKKMVVVGLAVLILFMYVYGFYKYFGADVIDEYEAVGGSVIALQGETGRSLQDPLLLDFARSDIQAYIYYRLYSPEDKQSFERVRGGTYLGAATLAVPRQIWPDRPATKVKAGTDLIYGDGAYEQLAKRSSRVYGLAGEAMLNFGPIAAPLSFIPLAIIVGWVRRKLRDWNLSDSRFLLVPLLVNLCFVILASDSDNVVFFLVKNGTIPFLVVFLGSRRITPNADFTKAAL